MFQNRKGSIRVCLTISLLIAVGAFVFWPEAPQPEDIVVAFIGDTQLNPTKPSLLELLAGNKIDVLFHGGDITYLKEPQQAWNAFLKQPFLRQVPVIATAGNADINEWKSYQEIVEKHNNATQDAQTGELRCSGILGIQSYCAVKGMLVVQLIAEPQIRRAASLLGYSVTSNPKFIENVFSTVNEETTLKICHFHHPHVDYRVELPRTDTVDLAEYEACREQGAMIVTAHDHVYARSQLMSDYTKHTVAKTENKDSADSTFTLKEGTSFTVISGLGGKSTVTLSPELVENPWWAVIWPGADVETRDHELGALLCSVPVMPNSGMIKCKFLTGRGKTIDNFSFKTDYE